MMSQSADLSAPHLSAAGMRSTVRWRIFAVLLFFAGCAALYVVGTALIAFPPLVRTRSA